MIGLVHVEDVRFSSAEPPTSASRKVQGGSLETSILESPVLIIEDEAMIAWTLESFLEDMGFKQIAIAASGLEAIEHAKRTPPGLILSDINLGASEMDGVAAATAIAVDADVSVVFITAHASTDARQRIARDLPDAALLRKPVDDTDLRRAIVDLAPRGRGH